MEVQGEREEQLLVKVFGSTVTPVDVEWQGALAEAIIDRSHQNETP